MEILWTRTVLFQTVCSVTSEPSRIGPINWVWKMKRKNELTFHWRIGLLPWTSPTLSQHLETKHELLSVGKEDTDDTIMWKSFIPTSCNRLKVLLKNRPDEDGNSYSSAPRIFQVSILSKNKSFGSYSCRNIYWTSVLGCLLWNKGERAVTALFSLELLPGELVTLVVVGVRWRPRTVQISNLAGKRGAGQESPLRVVPGVPMCMGGDPEHVHMIPCSSANCPGIVVSLAGIFISFPFVVLPGIN